MSCLVAQRESATNSKPALIEQAAGKAKRVVL